jgi:hypothetical protein
MSEANGGTEYTTGSPQVDAALRRLQAKNDIRFKDLEDAMLVQALLEKKMGERLKEHAEFLARHEKFLDRHEIMMSEFDDKLSGVIGSLDQFRQALAEFGKRP